MPIAPINKYIINNIYLVSIWILNNILCTYHVLFYSITTQIDIQNDDSVGNNIPESSQVIEVNVPSTNEHNM